MTRAAGIACVLALVALPVAAQDAGVRDAAADGAADAAAADAAALPDAGDPLDAPLPEAHRPRLEISLTPRERVFTGDLVHLTIVADAAQGDDVTVPVQSFGDLEVHDRHARVEPVQHGRQHFVFELGLLALEPGDREIAALRLRVVTHDGTVGAVRTEPIRLHVTSVLGNTRDAQPKPPTEPVAVWEKDYTLLWMAGGLGALLVTALLSFLLARWWTKRQKPVPPPPPPRPPWEVALESLEKIRREQAQLLATQRERELVDRVSDALRLYLGDRYGFDGLESTTDEILAHLKKRVGDTGQAPPRQAPPPLGGVPLDAVISFLGDSDLVKFAKLVPTAEQCDSLLASAFQLVRTTLPVARVVAPPPPPPGGAPR